MQEKARLMVVWLFDYLKNRCDYLKTPVIERDEEGTIISCGWIVDNDAQAALERKYRCNLPCLASDSCFIKIMPDDECIPIVDIQWYDDIEEVFTFLVSDQTEIVGQNSRPGTDSVESIVEAYDWDDGSCLFHTNDSEDDDYTTAMGIND